MWTAIWILSLLAFTAQADLSSSKKKVCVIGAGDSGLNSLKQLVDHLDEFEPIAFERISEPGGLWVYNEDGYVDNHGLPVHSSAYANLKTNTPKELMAFPDYPEFYGPPSSTVTHVDVMNYLKNFTNHFHLQNYIQFDTLVEKVSPIFDSSKGDNKDGEKTRWDVQTKNLNTGKISTTTCDAVMVASGQHFKPYIPRIAGIGKFKGMVEHSHNYRRPEVYAGKTVVVLGAGPSGVDVAIDIADYAKKVYLSHRYPKLASSLPKNLEQVLGVISAEEDKVVLSDGTKLVADAFIYATGYIFDYPFLDSSSGLIIEPKRIRPLYKQLINVNNPTLALVGVPTVTSPFLFPYFEAKYYVAYLRGIVKLPSKEEMLKDANTLPPGTPADKPHDLLGENLWNYIREWAKEVGFEPLPDYYAEGYKKWNEYRVKHLATFRNTDFRVHSNGVFNLIHPYDQADV